MKTEFGDVITSLPPQEVTKLYKALLTIVFSHRFNKQDPILTDVDFTCIWGILYFYTTEIRNKYMEDQYNSFLFHHFAVHGGSQFLESKASGKHPLYAAELEKELSSINQQAEATLSL